MITVKKGSLFLDEKELDPIDDLFSYYTPTAEMLEHIEAIRAALTQAGHVIHEHCPPGPDRTAAMRKLKEVQTTAGTAILHNGRSYR